MSFDERAADWEKLERRRLLAEAVADAITRRCALESSMRLLDIGAGTGLLSRRLAPKVHTVMALDSSQKMLDQLRGRAGAENVVPVHGDIMSYEPSEPFDGIVSSMTLHHIRDIPALFARLYDWLRPGAFVALADLAPEDGSFHDRGNEGVYHFGFEKEPLEKAAKNAGFDEVDYRIVHTIEKATDRRYDVFLLTAKR
jgi:cyclopropane fatty-acyl-phospholipid synthase-like methyltransferase